jgi:sialidase-1
MRFSGLSALAFVAAACSFAPTSSADPTIPIDIFVPAGEPNNYRIPALVRTSKGTLVAIAEARSSGADCCYKYLVSTRSTDNGTTWSPVSEIYGQSLPQTMGAGNPVAVFDNITNHIVLAGSVNDPNHCSPTLWTFVLDDGGSDGVSWSAPRNISAAIAPWGGATPGPGSGTQLGPLSAHPGRLIVPAHYGVYQDDISWYSDDHGATWTLSGTVLPNLDEVVTAALPSGRVMLNARSDHFNSSCDCRAVTYSEDGGATWNTPVQWDATLIEPVCQASLVTMGPLRDSQGGTSLFFSNPASKTERADITVRRSDDEGASWRANSWVVQRGPVWGGYSCIANGAPFTRADATNSTLFPAGQEFGGIVFERNHFVNGSEINVISFAMFPVDMPPQPPPPLHFVPAADPAFHWTGRRAADPDSGAVSFDFPGVTATLSAIGASFFTLEFAATCPGQTIRFESAVDAAPLVTNASGSFWLYTAPRNVTVSSGLDPSANHTLRMRLATEARNGGCGAAGPDPNSTVVFAGVWTDGTPLPAPATGTAAQRKIEFVGDSITAGAADAPNPGCPSMPAVQDPSQAASLGYICPSLNAECSIVAISGDTVLTPNPPIIYQQQKPPLPVVYNRTHSYIAATGSADTTWDFSSWVPDAVVVNLGTNDVAAENFNADYSGSLASFILQIAGPQGVYASLGLSVPNVLAYCGPMNFTYCGPMATAVATAAQSGAKASFLGPVNATLDGCDGHPGRQGQAEMGAKLTALIAAAMGW